MIRGWGVEQGFSSWQFAIGKQTVQNGKKRLGTSVCADISQHALKNHYVHCFYEKITQHIFCCMTFVWFLYQICLKKIVFRTDIQEKKHFFQSNLWMLYNSTAGAFWYIKKSTNGCKSFFHKCDKKSITHFAKQSFSVFQNYNNSTFKQTKI